MNSVLIGMPAQQRKSLLKHEASLRAAGKWGEWERLESEDFGRILGQRTGWVRDVKTVYRNRVFSVLVRGDKSGAIHCGISSLSGIRPTWHEMQRIKDDLFGQGKTGVEVYPPQGEIVDGADMFHLWILPDKLPFGLWGL